MTGLLSILLAVAYGFGGWQFWRGYQATNYTGLGNRITLSLLWLPLLAVNKSYRRNYQKALSSGK